MTLLLALGMAAGVLLCASVFLWPTLAARGNRRTSPALVRLRDRLTQAGLPGVSVGTFLAVSLVVALAVTALGAALVPVTALALLLGVFAAAIPFVIVNGRARAMRRATAAVWPDAVDHLVSAVRAGLALPDALATLAQTGPAATRESFRLYASDYAAMGDFGRALDELKARLASPTADRILETLRMSREVGGSELTGGLRDLAAYLRADAAIRSEVEARQSWVIVAARLGVIAPWIVLVLLASRPEAAAAYNSTAGMSVILAGLGATVIAYRLMVALGRLPEERRWFR